VQIQIAFPNIYDLTTIRMEPGPLVDDDRFFEFCMENQDLRIERTAEGEVIIMPPVGMEAGWRKSEMLAQLANWGDVDGRGRTFSNVGLILKNGAVRSPGACWIRKSQLEKLTKKQKREFPPLCPDFVIELKSPTDWLRPLMAKMTEWVKNGAELGWLIDPDRRTVTIYRPGRKREKLNNPTVVVGEGPVKGFRLELDEIWAGL